MIKCANDRLKFLVNRIDAIITASTVAILLTISSSVIAQQDIVITGQGIDPQINNAGVPDQVYEAWQGNTLLDIDTSDVNGYYGLKISQNEVKNSLNANNEYSLSHNYPEPYLEKTKLDLVIPDNTTIRIEIFNILGQRVGRQQSFSVFPGNYWLDISGLFVNGIYFVRVVSPEHSMVEKTLRLNEYSNISTSQLTKQAPNNLYNEPLITLLKGTSHNPINKVEEDLTIKVRSIGIIQYKDDEVRVAPKSKILNFKRIRI